MKKIPVKKKKEKASNTFTFLGIAVLVIAIGLSVIISVNEQELRGRAAENQIQFITATSANTGSQKPATTITLPAPSGSQDGDIMIAMLQADYGHIGGGLPDGWKLINERNENDDLTLHTYYKVVSGKEPTNYTWNIILSGKNEALAGGTVLLFRGVDTKNPIAGKAINPETEDVTKIECPSVLAPAGGMLICGFTDDDPAKDIKVPDSMKRVSYFTIRDNDAHAVAYEPITSEGQTGTRDAALDLTDVNIGKTNNDISIGIVLLPKNGVIPGLSPTITNVQPSSVSIRGPQSASLSATPIASDSGTTSQKSLLVQFLEALLTLLRHFI